MKLKVGEMIYHFRKQKGIKAKELCYGICSRATMSYKENGERRIDILEFEYFMERMGERPREFSVMITENESAYLEWKENILSAINHSNWKQLERLLKEKKAFFCNGRLVQQFFLYAWGVLRASQKRYDEAFVFLEQGVQSTDSEGMLSNDKIYLSSTELQLLIVYLYYGIITKKLSVLEGKQLFSKLEAYISSEMIESKLQAKCYAKLICMGCSIDNLMGNKKRLACLKKAIQFCKEDKSFFDLSEILRLYNAEIKAEHIEGNGYQELYTIFCELLESEGCDSGFRIETTIYEQPNCYFVKKILMSGRKEKGVSQEKISEGICEPETYSRIESGKQVPSTKHLKLFSEKLGIEWRDYRGEIITNNPKAFRLRYLQRCAVREGKYIEALDHIEALELLLDTSIIENYIYLQKATCDISYRLGKIGDDEVIQRMEELLSLSLSKHKKEPLLYSQTELEIIGMLAQRLKTKGEYIKGIQLLEEVLRSSNYDESIIHGSWNAYIYLINILGNLYFRTQRYEECVRTQNYVKRIDIQQRNASCLVGVLDSIADAYEHMGEEGERKACKTYIQAYHIAWFYEYKREKTFLKNYLFEMFNVKL